MDTAPTAALAVALVALLIVIAFSSGTRDNEWSIAARVGEHESASHQ